MITIREPIWKNLSVGLEESKLVDPVKVEITYTNKQGNRVFPNTYSIPASVAKGYPIMLRMGKKLYIIPITALKEE